MIKFNIFGWNVILYAGRALDMGLWVYYLRDRGWVGDPIDSFADFGTRILFFEVSLSLFRESRQV